MPRVACQWVLQCESNNPPCGLLTFFLNGWAWEFLVSFYTPIMTYVSIYSRLQIFIQLSLTLTKLCYIKRDYLASWIVVCGKSFQIWSWSSVLLKYESRWNQPFAVVNEHQEQSSDFTPPIRRRNGWRWIVPTSSQIGPVASKLTRSQPTRLPCVGCDSSSISQQSKPKTIPELKSTLQQIWDDLPQTTINKAIYDFCKRLNAWAYFMNYGVALNMA